jgi:hypothetical protein
MIRKRSAPVLATLLALTACGGAVAESGSASRGETTVMRASIVIETTNGYRVDGESVWEGRYLCPQGVTGLTLELSGGGGAEVAAVFHFYAVPENPGVPTGSYTLRGVVRGDGTIDLSPERWIEEPYGYVMVGMTGILDRASGIMRGRIAAAECAGFDLHRVR